MGTTIKHETLVQWCADQPVDKMPVQT